MITIDWLYATESSDCTTAFLVEFDRSYTIGEFITEFFENTREHRWGYIKIGKSEKDYFGERIAFYQFGKWQVECPKEYLNRVIKTAHGRGGWSNYDFVFVLED